MPANNERSENLCSSFHESTVRSRDAPAAGERIVKQQNASALNLRRHEFVPRDATRTGCLQRPNVLGVELWEHFDHGCKRIPLLGWHSDDEVRRIAQAVSVAPKKQSEERCKNKGVLAPRFAARGVLIAA